MCVPAPPGVFLPVKVPKHRFLSCSRSRQPFSEGDDQLIDMVAFTLTRSTHARNAWRFHHQVEHHAGAASLSVTSTCTEPATADTSPLLEVPRWPDEGQTFAACSRLCVEILGGGDRGARPQSGDTVRIQYACLLATSGCCVDASRSKMFSGRGPLTIKLGSKQVVHGMEIGLCALTLGSLARIHVPPDFAYGELGSGPIPPSAHLVFEVEMLGINDRQTSTRNSWLLRRLLMLPPPADLPERAARLPGTPPVNMPLRYHASSPSEMQLPPLLVYQPERARAAAAAAAAEDERRFAASDPEAIADALPTDSPLSQLSNLEPLAQLPPWLRRLRSPQPLPTPESRSYFAFARLHRALLPLPSRDAAAFTSHALDSPLDSATPNGAAGAGAAAAPSTAAGEDLGPKLISGASPILHAPYGTAWDSRTPMVLTGERAETGWPAAAWGWSFWEREYGDQYVTCKQRAPLFDSDQTGDTLIVETSLREAMQYARTAHLSGAAEAGKAPVLYMNGWDVFEALPQLWHPDIDKLPNTTHPRTVAEYERLHAAFNLDSVGAIVAKARGLCKLFAGPIGAITRIHQDNHDAHAWLCNVRGRKLYVLCRPEDSPAACKCSPRRPLSSPQVRALPARGLAQSRAAAGTRQGARHAVQRPTGPARPARPAARARLRPRALCDSARAWADHSGSDGLVALRCLAHALAHADVQLLGPCQCPRTARHVLSAGGEGNRQDASRGTHQPEAGQRSAASGRGEPQRAHPNAHAATHLPRCTQTLRLRPRGTFHRGAHARHPAHRAALSSRRGAGRLAALRRALRQGPVRLGSRGRLIPWGSRPLDDSRARTRWTPDPGASGTGPASTLKPKRGSFQESDVE